MHSELTLKCIQNDTDVTWSIIPFYLFGGGATAFCLLFEQNLCLYSSAFETQFFGLIRNAELGWCQKSTQQRPFRLHSSFIFHHRTGQALIRTLLFWEVSCEGSFLVEHKMYTTRFFTLFPAEYKIYVSAHFVGNTHWALLYGALHRHPYTQTHAYYIHYIYRCVCKYIADRFIHQHAACRWLCKHT